MRQSQPRPQIFFRRFGELAAVHGEWRKKEKSWLGANAERAALWGADAAARLAALDRQRADWDRRVAAYGSERDHLNQGNRSDADRALAVTQLRERRFTDPSERQRVEALEAVGALGGR